MGFVNGRTYRFVSNAFRGYALNVYGTNAASTGRNICLFTNDTADIMQKWVVQSSSGSHFRMHSSVNNNFVLDRSDGTLSTSYSNNALGIDVICEAGTKIYSPAAGKVYARGANEADSRGNFVVLEMDQKDPVTNKTMYVRFLHMLEAPKVSIGQRVTASTVLGLVGSTGQSTANHLHLDITNMPLSSNPENGNNQTADNTINPINFFPSITFPNRYYTVGSYI